MSAMVCHNAAGWSSCRDDTPNNRDWDPSNHMGVNHNFHYMLRCLLMAVTDHQLFCQVWKLKDACQLTTSWVTCLKELEYTVVYNSIKLTWRLIAYHGLPSWCNQGTVMGTMMNLSSHWMWNSTCKGKKTYVLNSWQWRNRNCWVPMDAAQMHCAVMQGNTRIIQCAQGLARLVMVVTHFMADIQKACHGEHVGNSDTPKS